MSLWGTNTRNAYPSRLLLLWRHALLLGNRLVLLPGFRKSITQDASNCIPRPLDIVHKLLKCYVCLVLRNRIRHCCRLRNQFPVIICMVHFLKFHFSSRQNWTAKVREWLKKVKLQVGLCQCVCDLVLTNGSDHQCKKWNYLLFYITWKYTSSAKKESVLDRKNIFCFVFKSSLQ